MLIALLIKVGLPLMGVGIGWLAKKWHVAPAIEAAFDQGATIALSTAAAKAHALGQPGVAAAIAALATEEATEAVTPTSKVVVK